MPEACKKLAGGPVNNVSETTGYLN